MKSVRIKFLISVLVIIMTMAVLPLVVINIADSWDALGYFLLLIIILNPVIAIILGIFNGSMFYKLWYIPLIILIVFPLFFWVVLKEVILELYIYSAGYAVLNLCAMIITHTVVKNVKLKRIRRSTK